MVFFVRKEPEEVEVNACDWCGDTEFVGLMEGETDLYKCADDAACYERQKVNLKERPEENGTP